MILVTGAGGSVGREMVKLLLQEKEEVVGVDRNKETVFGATCENCDLSDLESVKQLFEKYDFDTIIHLAATLYTISNNEPIKGIEDNAIASYNLLKMNAQKKAKFIYGSSIDVYGKIETSKENPAREATIPNLSNNYAFSKAAGEKWGEFMSQAYGFDFVSARIPVMLGVDQGSKNSMWRERVFTSVKDSAPIDITYGETSPFVPVANVKDTVRPLYILAKNSFKAKLYNLPCEAVRMKTLGDAVKSVNKEVVVNYGTRDVAPTCPQFVDDSLFCEEFGYKAVSIVKQIVDYAK